MQLITSIEPSLEADNLNSKQVDYLIKKIRALYGTNKNKYVDELVKKLQNTVQLNENGHKSDYLASKLVLD